MLVIKRAGEGNKIIIYSIIIVAMLFASGYLFYKQFSGSNEAINSVAVSAPAGQPAIAGSNDIAVAMPVPGSNVTAPGNVPSKISLNSVDIKKVVDTSIFDDPKFKALVDSTLQRQPSLVGTKNPFGQ
jgi:hypothetical protein